MNFAAYVYVVRVFLCGYEQYRTKICIKVQNLCGGAQNNLRKPLPPAHRAHITRGGQGEKVDEHLFPPVDFKVTEI